MSQDSDDGVLIIHRGALTDFVLSLTTLRSLRHYHRDRRVILFLNDESVALAKALDLADEILIDERPAPWRFDRIYRQRRRFAQFSFSQVYDFSGDRGGAGIARRGGATYHPVGSDGAGHRADDEAGFLADAGIPRCKNGLFDLSPSLERLALPERFALIFPGGGLAGRPESLWPEVQFAKLAQTLGAKGIEPLILGGEADRSLITFVHKRCLKSRNLATDLADVEVVGLARAAYAAIGNDTGQLYLSAAVGCPTLFLACPASEPAKRAPRGATAKTLVCEDLRDLPLSDVLSELPATRPKLEIELEIGKDPEGL